MRDPREEPSDLDLEFGEALTCECPECGTDFSATPGVVIACPSCGMVCDPCDPHACGQAD